MLRTLARSAITAVVLAAAGAASSYAMRRYVAKRSRRTGGDERIDESRWEGEGGSPKDATAAVPHQSITAR